MKLSELTKIEAQMGFLIGILIGVLASWTFIVFFTTWQWYFKVFSSIGEIGIMGSLVMQLNETRKARRNYIDVQKEMKKMGNINQSKELNERRYKNGR